VERGRGTSRRRSESPEARPIKALLIDATLPSKRANFHVESLATPSARRSGSSWRSGQRRRDARAAVADASRILADHFALLIDFARGRGRGGDPAELPVRGELNEHLFRSVDELELSVRPSNCLKTANIRNHRGPGSRRRIELLKTKELGKKSLNEIKTILGGMGLSLGMRLDPEELERLHAHDAPTIAS